MKMQTGAGGQKGDQTELLFGTTGPLLCSSSCPPLKLFIHASACKSFNVTVRGAAHHHECHCCNQTFPKIKTQFASKNSTTKPQQAETSASPQGQLQKVSQI